jgi:hypothetical protein
MSTIQRSKLKQGVAVNVIKAQRVADYKLRLAFSDGFEREVDFEPFLRGSSNPLISVYLDAEKFARFVLKDGELIWGEYELCFPMSDLYEGKI